MNKKDQSFFFDAGYEAALEEISGHLDWLTNVFKRNLENDKKNRRTTKRAKKRSKKN